MGAHFSRSVMIAGLIVAAKQAGQGIEHVPQYVSRGHGIGSYSGRKKANKRGRYMPHQGEQEKARRRRQMERDAIAAADRHNAAMYERLGIVSA